MRILGLLIAAVILLGPTANSQTLSSGALGLKPEQIPAECKPIEGDFPVDMQSAILWDKPELYKDLIPLPLAKTAQSFACNGNKGTVYFFQFGSEAQRKTAGAFIKPLLWGESGPTPLHPESVLEAGDTLIVVSFRNPSKSLLAAFQLPRPSRTASPGDPKGKTFHIPGHGGLRLELPEGWQLQSKELTDPPSVTLHFLPAIGDGFDVQVTAVWLAATKRAGATPESLKASVEHTGASLLPHSVEKTVTIHDLNGLKTVGFYYSLTDNSPGPGEFSNMTQGEFLTGDVLSAFTILHRTSASAEVDQALHAFAEAEPIN
jgi:hypothetical protein